MGFRLSKIYTKTGDKGNTGLGDGSRVAKDNLRVECYGEIDELNSWVGLLRTAEIPPPVEPLLAAIQHDLFDLGGEVSIPGHSLLPAKRVEAVEEWLDRLNQDLSPLEEFILPGGCRAAAFCHLARCVCRRAERRMVSLSKVEELNSSSLKYINRLSDLFFVLARVLNREAHKPDVLWNRDRSGEA